MTSEEVRQQMLDNLPTHLNTKQKQNVAKLLQDYEDIFSLGEYDIGRTNYVEYKIYTGSHHPIRQQFHGFSFPQRDCRFIQGV